jgi:hypothetical protein
MTYTPEYKLLREYAHNRNKVIKLINADSQKGTDVLNQLKTQYAKLIFN